ncbi:subtilisin-like protease SBT1.7 [Cryptomeria japonica]|uniref:subtilisin-like protease SBT1.7 n=1 Tax=Cryptomeria japonica TaxID=3369 RepID=UPI0025ABC2E8|nr:subtilisin-like protease SBT1.7 [Cryptomeria japonica]
MENWVRVLLFLCCLVTVGFAAISSDGETKTYIVHVDRSQMPAAFLSHENWYASSVKSVLGVEDEVSILYNYEEAFHGFATRLNAAQAAALEKMDGVLGIYPETIYELHTTRSPEFLGLDAVTAMQPDGPNYGQDVVVGVLDTGIWPESESFNDRGLGPVPLHWKGECEVGTKFKATVCNKKIVGARFFSNGYEAAVGPINETAEFRSPRDQDGHGTHTASTAVGSEVIGASLLGYANGSARGMAPKARIAAYKVCWVGGCFSTDILKAIDKAVADGVNVLSMSLGGGIAPYYRDSISLGAFGAMQRGIFVSCSAGNSGPDAVSLSNVAPWITTVGASTMDRNFPADIKLGNGMIFGGVSLYHGRQTLGTKVPLVYQSSNSSSTGGSPMNLCLTGTLDPKTVAGKIVVCDRGITARVAKGAVVKAAGGAGMILANTEANGEELVADCHMLPASAVGQKEGEAIKKYIKSTPNPTATILFKGTVLGVKPSPVVAAFSSRGPNIVNPDILKPDVIAPGVNILAAWTAFEAPTGLSNDPRRVKFNIISGTSMSCPHVSGIAAIIKGAHPDWSPAAIKSALMTTAYVLDNTGKTLQDAATANASNAFDHGAGHVDPKKALNPGLVYDITADDYVEFLCSLKYTPAQINLITKSNATCRNTLHSPGDLNYPSFSPVFSVPSNSSSDIVVKYTRTLTNVGPAGSKYNVTTVHQSTEVSTVVEPQTLYFAKTGDKQTYTVTFTGKPLPVVSGLLIATFGSLTWSDGVHDVRSPIAFSWQSADSF